MPIHPGLSCGMGGRPTGRRSCLLGVGHVLRPHLCATVLLIVTRRWRLRILSLLLQGLVVLII